MKSTALRYGLLSALTAVFLFTASYLIFKGNEDYSAQEVVGYTSMLLSMVFVFFGIKHYRDKVNNGQLTFGQGMKVGFLIVLIPSLVFGIFEVVYVEYINPELMTKYYDYKLVEMKKSLSGAEFQAARSKMESEKEMFQSPVVQFIVGFLTLFVIGVIYTVISSLILRRNVARS